MNFNDGDFKLVEPFYIDNGELDGLKPDFIFVIGYEFGLIMRSVDLGRTFECQFHSENIDRVRETLEARKVNFSIDQWHDDWATLIVQSS